jgi:hypothetical protein
MKIFSSIKKRFSKRILNKCPYCGEKIVKKDCFIQLDNSKGFYATVTYCNGNSYCHIFDVEYEDFSSDKPDETI